MERNGFGTWKVRLTPRCTSRCGGWRETLSPPRRTSPASAWRMPEITLMQVVLPDPFGPTRPRISPARTWKLTPSSARNPPKRLTSLSTTSSGSGDIDSPAPRERGEAVGHKEHEQHDEDAVDQLEILRSRDADGVVDAVEDEDAEHRPEHGGRAAEVREGEAQERGEHERDDDRGEAPADHCRDSGHVQVQDEQREAVRARAEEADVAEGQVPGEAVDDVDALGEREEDDDVEEQEVV